MTTAYAPGQLEEDLAAILAADRPVRAKQRRVPVAAAASLVAVAAIGAAAWTWRPAGMPAGAPPTRVQLATAPAARGPAAGDAAAPVQPTSPVQSRSTVAQVRVASSAPGDTIAPEDRAAGGPASGGRRKPVAADRDPPRALASIDRADVPAAAASQGASADAAQVRSPVEAPVQPATELALAASGSAPAFSAEPPAGAEDPRTVARVREQRSIDAIRSLRRQ